MSDEEATDCDSDLTEQLTVRWTLAQPVLTSYIASTVRNKNDVQDVVQDVAVAVARGYAKSDRSRPFLPWALGIARHKIADYQRKYYSNKQIFDSELLEKISVAYHEIEPEVNDTRRALDDCVARLQERGQAIVKLRYTHDLKPPQIADRVGLSANAVAVALHRIRKTLSDCVRSRLEREGEKS